MSDNLITAVEYDSPAAVEYYMPTASLREIENAFLTACFLGHYKAVEILIKHECITPSLINKGCEYAIIYGRHELVIFFKINFVINVIATPRTDKNKYENHRIDLLSTQKASTLF